GAPWRFREFACALARVGHPVGSDPRWRASRKPFRRYRADAYFRRDELDGAAHPPPTVVARRSKLRGTLEARRDARTRGRCAVAARATGGGRERPAVPVREGVRADREDRGAARHGARDPRRTLRSAGARYR